MISPASSTMFLMCRLQSNTPRERSHALRVFSSIHCLSRPSCCRQNGNQDAGEVGDQSDTDFECHAPFSGGSRVTALIWIMCGASLILRHPSACCAPAENGDAAAPPIRLMNCRRRMWIAMRPSHGGHETEGTISHLACCAAGFQSAQCPEWVIFGSGGATSPLPLHPDHRTSSARSATSETCQQAKSCRL